MQWDSITYRDVGKSNMNFYHRILVVERCENLGKLVHQVRLGHDITPHEGVGTFKPSGQACQGAFPPFPTLYLPFLLVGASTVVPQWLHTLAKTES